MVDGPLVSDAPRVFPDQLWGMHGIYGCSPPMRCCQLSTPARRPPQSDGTYGELGVHREQGLNPRTLERTEAAGSCLQAQPPFPLSCTE